MCWPASSGTRRSMPFCRSSRRPCCGRRRSPKRAGGQARRSVRSTACRPRSRTISGRKACRPGAAPKPAIAAPAQADSPAVARLREQGAVILGKTCMPEHGWIGVCHSPLTGITRNPWNPEHTPGGSTGGGAVAALLGLGRAASGHRWRRLAADSGGLHRRIRHEAELRPGAGLSGAAAQRALASGADHPHASPMPR